MVTFQDIIHFKEHDSCVKFLFRALMDNNEKDIMKWVRDKLLNGATKINQNTTEAFFEAEKILIDSYIKTGNVESVTALINAVNASNNHFLRKHQCSILLLSIKKQQNVLYNNPEQLYTH